MISYHSDMLIKQTNVASSKAGFELWTASNRTVVRSIEMFLKISPKSLETRIDWTTTPSPESNNPQHLWSCALSSSCMWESNGAARFWDPCSEVPPCLVQRDWRVSATH